MKHLRGLCLLLAVFLPWGTAAAALPGHACATAHPLATQACIGVLREGGNAFDAAVAASAALAVVEPTGSGLGGGGFWLLHRAADGADIFVDGRETAPAAAHPDMYLNARGEAVAKRSRDGALAAAIPGEPAALVHLAQHYGSRPLAQLLAPAIVHAREGFEVDAKLADAFARHWPRFSPAARRTLGIAGRAPRAGERLRQPDLAVVLERLARDGRAGFYEGETARLLVRGVRAAGGIWTLEDLRRYRVVERSPLVSWFRDYRIVSAPPPSAGGLALAQVFGQLEALGVSALHGPEFTHLLVEALRRAYRDRAAYLGDPDFVSLPLVHLASRSYARALASSIQRDRATPSAALPPAEPTDEGTDTTHFSVVDAQGNRVAGTLSLNLPFGSADLAPGTGVLLNDEMDDFAASTTASNAYGLIGSQANRIQPGKRPLSSMTPTFVEGPRGLLVLGTPGGSRIISMVLLGILEWMDGGDATAVVARGRLHHQYLPDVLQFEPGALSPEVLDALKARGHALRPLDSAYGNLQAVLFDAASGRLDAAADPRGVGSAVVVAHP
ncbi:MAG: gamma-glutamyltransferase [Gammaproteobacteria bacterium]